VTDFTPLKYVTAPRPLKLTVRGKNVRQETAKVVFELQVPISSTLYARNLQL
jgi:hypothetical protein